MTGVLAAYLRRRVFAHTLMVAAILIGLMQVLELMDVTSDILDRGLGIQGMLYYAALRAPSEIVLALPLAALLGAISAFREMTRNDEMVPMRAAGISLQRIMVFLLPVPLVVALLQVALSQGVVPAAEARLKAWWEATAPPEEAPARRWLRTRAGPVSFATASHDGRVLADVRIYVRGEDGLLAARIAAHAARWEAGAWRLEQVRELGFGGEQVRRVAERARPWETNLLPEDVGLLDVAQPRLSSLTLADVIAGERVGAQPLSYYRTALYRSLTAPFTAFIMLLLAMPVALGRPRAGGESALLVALMLGLGFLVCDGIMAALGSGGRMPAGAAALAAPALFFTFGLLHLLKGERP